MKRAVSVHQLLKKKFEIMPFTGVWFDTFGKPELSGSWIFWGNSGNGKTRFVLQLAKYLSQFGKVVYNTLEEGARLSMQKAVRETNMLEVAKVFQILNKENMDDLRERLSKQKSPRIIIIDSIQYTELNKKTYKKLISDFPKKLFIFISHAEGKHPDGRLAKSVRYDADIKGFIEGYKLTATSRLGGGKEYIIWQKGADEYWGNIN